MKDIFLSTFQQEKVEKGRNQQEGVLCAVNCQVVGKRELLIGAKIVINLYVFHNVFEIYHTQLNYKEKAVEIIDQGNVVNLL